MTDPLTALMAFPGIGPYIPYITLAVAIASGVATVLPAPKDGDSAVYAAIYAVVHWVALNKGNATAAKEPVQ